jgi:hypothetical protein
MGTLRKKVSSKFNKTSASSKTLTKLISLDRVVSDQFNGQYTMPIGHDTVRYNVKKIDSYCKAHGIKPENLSKEDLENFIIN